jgi:hypothetical protein
MAKTVLYEGYAIQSSPRYVAESEKWQLCVVISIRPHGGVKPRTFSSEVLCATEQEAELQGIDFGQRIIDGKVEGLSVAYMKMENRRTTPRFQIPGRQRGQVSCSISLPAGVSWKVRSPSAGGNCWNYMLLCPAWSRGS